MVKNMSTKHLFCLLITSFILTRLISLGLYPLYDTTEARYGEIARIMLETGNWITPQFDYNIPFWGKPPLHTWVSALSFGLFGVSEFSARLPHFIAGLCSVLLVFHLVKKLTTQAHALTASLICVSTLGFIIATGMVMTDSLLLLSITLAMSSFIINYQSTKPSLYGQLFFIALALGMLAKGPVAAVLIGVALVTWSISQKCFVKAICSLPWFSGLVLFCVVAVPWYLLAEQATPGFLEYFLWGEHVERFLVSGWQGDLYGSAHDEPKGKIWLFWLAAAFPWSFVLLWQLRPNQVRKTPQAPPLSRSLNSYFICWTLSPLLLFTLAGNILPAYVLPGVSAMACYLALNVKNDKVIGLAAIISFLITCIALIFFASGASSKVSQKQVIESLNSQARSNVVYYWQKRPFSAQFYSYGNAELIEHSAQLAKLIELHQTAVVIVREKDLIDFNSMPYLCKTKSKLGEFNTLICTGKK